MSFWRLSGVLGSFLVPKLVPNSGQKRYLGLGNVLVALSGPLWPRSGGHFGVILEAQWHQIEHVGAFGSPSGGIWSPLGASGQVFFIRWVQGSASTEKKHLLGAPSGVLLAAFGNHSLPWLPLLVPKVVPKRFQVVLIQIARGAVWYAAHSVLF